MLHVACLRECSMHHFFVTAYVAPIGRWTSDRSRPKADGARRECWLVDRLIDLSADSIVFCPLFLFQKPRGLSSQYWKNAFGRLRQKPRQRHLDAQRVVQHLYGPRGSLTQRAHVEAQRISFPGLLLDHDHRSKITFHVAKALFEPMDSLDLADTMANDNCDAIAHGKGANVAWMYRRYYGRTAISTKIDGGSDPLPCWVARNGVGTSH